jgi:glycosyltransferase involved in cell wall biosynthesis
MVEYYPKISIVTPNFNNASFIEETILSIVCQDYPNLEYIVIDGGSIDGSVEIIKKYEKSLTYWISEPDNGMYFAIQKGFDRCTGEIMGWLNSDDILHKKSLFAVAEIFSGNKEILWLQGYPNVIDERGRIVYHRPHCSSRFSFYLGDYRYGNFVQQESTFWRRKLWEKCGSNVSDKYKFAGDFELWMRFFSNADLYNTATFLGSFRIHKHGQVSVKSYSEYISECDKIITEYLSKLPSEDRRILSHIKFWRKVLRISPGIGRLFTDKIEDKYLGSAFNVDYDFDLNKFAVKKRL